MEDVQGCHVTGSEGAAVACPAGKEIEALPAGEEAEALSTGKKAEALKLEPELLVLVATSCKQNIRE